MVSALTLSFWLLSRTRSRRGYKALFDCLGPAMLDGIFSNYRRVADFNTVDNGGNGQPRIQIVCSDARLLHLQHCASEGTTVKILEAIKMVHKLSTSSRKRVWRLGQPMERLLPAHQLAQGGTRGLKDLLRYSASLCSGLGRTWSPSWTIALEYPGLSMLRTWQILQTCDVDGCFGASCRAQCLYPAETRHPQNH